ncbi:MAG TPA: ABC transporter substrate-binding protein [Roseiarcus sp.]|jgi:NitT/TauT family transport system substrate-binding protein|nr:ABC transporter substrate-binding protein [Roseiarcus sp.]
MFPTRREILFGAAATVTGGLIWSDGPRFVHAQEAPPETTRIRLAKPPTLCDAPEFALDELLAADGITEVEYIVTDVGPILNEAIASGRIDFAQHFSGPMIVEIDRGKRITMLAGVHVGCFELFAKDGINSVGDLKGRWVGIPGMGSSAHVFLSAMATLIGLDPTRDINWVTSAEAKPVEMFLDGKVDAFLGFPPDPQRLRAQGVSHVIVNSAQDRPWSQYFCCMLAGNPDFVRTKPIATKCMVRAMLRASDLCLSAPSRVARRNVDRGFTPNYEYALQTLSDVPYGRWREYDPEDTIRFYALRLREAGMIKSSPDQIIADGTDWRFLREVRRELG